MADFRFEISAGFPSALVAGVDEVGRGCIAGPVVAAAVIFPAHFSVESQPWLKDVTDSKALTAKRRSALSQKIKEAALSVSVASASLEEISSLNILWASHLAMERAIRGLSSAPAHVLVDGNMIPKNLPCAATSIIGGDALSLTIAAASIVAKVWRDEYMIALEEKFPGYGFASHKGYGTAQHISALEKMGVTPEHRTDFAPVAKLLATVGA